MSTSFIISKKFKFDAGHRVWTQELDNSLSEDPSCVCKHLHGHEYHVEVYLKKVDNGLQHNGMVTDFKHLNWFKSFLDSIFDHSFMIHYEDPLYSELVLESIDKAKCKNKSMLYFDPYKVKVIQVNYDNIGDIELNLDLDAVRLLCNGCIDIHHEELVNSFTITSFVPTAENLAKYFYNIVNIVFKDKGIICPKVIVWETSKSKAEYGVIE